MSRSVRIVAAKGGTLAHITAGDVLEILDAEYAVRGCAVSGSATFRMLREAGVLDADTPTLAQARSVCSAFGRPTRRSPPDHLPPDPGSAGGLSGRSGNRRSTTPPWSAWPITWCDVFGSTSSSTTPASIRCGCRARSPEPGSGGCTPKPPSSFATANASRLSLNASITWTCSLRCGRSISTWPGGVSMTPSMGCVGSAVPDQPTGPSAAQVYSPPQSTYGQPYPGTAARVAGPGPGRRPVAARVGATVELHNRPSRASSSAPQGRP